MVLLKAMGQTNNKNLLMHFKGYEDFVSRILDLQAKAKRYRNIIHTPFLSEKEREIVYQIVTDCFVYEDAVCFERKKLAISYYEEENIVFPIVCLSDRYDPKFHKITHSDVLGAVMNLGVEQSVVGDILVEDGRLYLFVDEDIASFFMSELTMVKRLPIRLSPYYEKVEKKVSFAYSNYSVSSFRLDAIVAAITHLSREKAKQLIKGGKVKVNQVVLEDYDYLCNNNSTISIRRYGRFIVSDSNRRTKKDRYVIEVAKYV